MEKAIIIGASSGIGRELSRIMARARFKVGLAARREELLKEVLDEFPELVVIKRMDVDDHINAISILNGLIEEMEGVDIIIISAGIGFLNEKLDLEKEMKTINTNIIGFTAIAGAAFKYFLERKQGHLVAITSIASIRGSRECPAYNASKAYQANYLEGLRQNVFHLGLPITITDIQPGLVDTDMAQGDKLFWVAGPQIAAEQIYKKILLKKDFAYITKRWRLFGWILKIVPSWLYKRL